jgi:hypothetical protein
MNNSELHIFENHHTYDLMLPKPACKGLTTVKPKGVFIADKSFQEYVKVGMIRYIGPYEQKKEVIMEHKLILDQPPIVTNEGKVEHVIAGKKKILNEGEAGDKENILLVESPADKIKIIAD